MSPLLEQHREEIIVICRKYAVKRLDVFGSAARGDFDAQTSDFDFFYELEREPLDSYADRFFGLLQDLQQLLNRHIDLVHEPSARNPYFLKSANTHRLRLYAA